MTYFKKFDFRVSCRGSIQDR